MKDDFETHQIGLTAPATQAIQIVPSNTQDLNRVPRAIFVGQAGSLTVEMTGAPAGETVTLYNVQAGMAYPLRVRRVLADGTTAAGLIGLW